MAIIKAISSKATIKRATDYISNKEKTNDSLMDGINCKPKTARIEMETVQRGYEKTDGRTYKHFTLDYHKDDNITPEQCLKNARKLCEETKAFQGHQVLIAVHTDKPHIHAHIIVSSVNMENGKKLQWNKSDLTDMKNRCNELSREQNLHIPEKGKTFEGKENGNTSTYTKEAYKSITDEKSSWVVRTGLAAMECKERAVSQQDFIKRMNEKGYDVKWTDNRKNITFTDIERQKSGEKKCSVRDKKLEEHFHIDFGKESLTNELERNARSEAERTAGKDLERRGREAVDRVYRSAGDSAEPSRPAGAGIDESASREAISSTEQFLTNRAIRQSQEVIDRHRQRTADNEQARRAGEAEQSKGGRAVPRGSGTGLHTRTV